MSEWETAQIALVVSGLSLLLALASFVWNVWSKFIYPKPKLEVKVSYTFAVGEGYEGIPDAISLTAINHGPSEITLTSAIGWVRPENIFGTSRRAVLRIFQNYPYSNQTNFSAAPTLPSRLKVGEQVTLYLPESREIFTTVKNLGFTDGFGREHFARGASKRNVRRLATRQA